MPMYCKKCGAEIGAGLRVCLNCGEEVDLDRDQVREQFSDGVVEEGYYDSDAARKDELENREEMQQEVKKRMAGSILITLLIALAVIAIALAVMATNKTGIFADKDPDDLFADQGDETQVIATVDTPDVIDETPVIDDTPVIDEQPAEQIEETPEVAEPEDEKAAQAEEIRRLLTSKKWKTTIEGYNGEVEFKSDGKAVITVKILMLKKSIDAKYILTDDCEFTFTADYNGSAYGISGTIEKISDNELRVTRAKNGETITLTAA